MGFIGCPPSHNALLFFLNSTNKLPSQSLKYFLYYLFVDRIGDDLVHIMLAGKFNMSAPCKSWDWNLHGVIESSKWFAKVSRVQAPHEQRF